MNKMMKPFLGIIKEFDDEERTLTVLFTTPETDRVGEVLEPMGADLKNYQKNPVVMWCHKYDQPPIAKSLWVKKSKEGILAKPQFAPTQFASEIYNLYKGGFLNSWSAGFLPQKWEDGQKDGEPKRRYTEWELLEYSAVPIPANPQALTQIRAIVKSMEIVNAVEEEQKKLDGEVLKPEETEDYIHIPVEDAEKFVSESFRTITISEKEGIQAVIGKYKSDPDGSTHVQKYLFDKAKGWTMEKAKQWVADNHKSIEWLIDEWQVEIDVLTANQITEEQKQAIDSVPGLKSQIEVAGNIITELRTELETKVKDKSGDDQIPIETPKKEVGITAEEAQAIIEKAMTGAITKEFNRIMGKVS